jgi:S-adenosylmethionine decarboxylase proenzyme
MARNPSGGDVELVHVMAELSGVAPATLDDPAGLAALLEACVRRAGFAPVASCAYRFHPRGASVVLILTESHASIHTWPEAGFAAVDLFACIGRGPALAAMDYLSEALRARSSEVRTLGRGTAPARLHADGLEPDAVRPTPA